MTTKNRPRGFALIIVLLALGALAIFFMRPFLDGRTSTHLVQTRVESWFAARALLARCLDERGLLEPEPVPPTPALVLFPKELTLPDGTCTFVRDARDDEVVTEVNALAANSTTVRVSVHQRSGQLPYVVVH